MSKCICNDFEVQIEQSPGDFYDPENSLPVLPDGRKCRRIWFGCPQHNGHSNQREPSVKEIIAKASKAK